eukprot:128764-Lingulodinium_polyedra.AAC.1
MPASALAGSRHRCAEMYAGAPISFRSPPRMQFKRTCSPASTAARDLSSVQWVRRLVGLVPL